MYNAASFDQGKSMNRASMQDHLFGRVHDEHLNEHQFDLHAEVSAIIETW